MANGIRGCATFPLTNVAWYGVIVQPLDRIYIYGICARARVKTVCVTFILLLLLLLLHGVSLDRRLASSFRFRHTRFFCAAYVPHVTVYRRDSIIMTRRRQAATASSVADDGESAVRYFFIFIFRLFFFFFFF